VKKRAIACWQVHFLSLPGPGMPRLVHEDREITQEHAQSIAAYILETFNGQQ
jgi:hypothetical protein